MSRLVGNPAAHLTKDGHTSIGKWYNIKAVLTGITTIAGGPAQAVARGLVYRGGGSWRLRLNIYVRISQISNELALTIPGLRFSSRFEGAAGVSDAAKGQAMTTNDTDTQAIAVSGEGYIFLDHASNSNIMISGDVELDGKPDFVK